MKQRLAPRFSTSLPGPTAGAAASTALILLFALVSYLENIVYDRRLIGHCSLRLGLLYFLDHQLDHPLPWHSTLSRIRHILPMEWFEKVFTHVLSLCAEAGIVSCNVQAVDSFQHSSC